MVELRVFVLGAREISCWHWTIGQDGGIDRLSRETPGRSARRWGAVEVFERCHGLQNASGALQDLWSKGSVKTVRRYSAWKKSKNWNDSANSTFLLVACPTCTIVGFCVVRDSLLCRTALRERHGERIRGMGGAI